MARRGPSGDPKTAALREARCLNPHPERVSDERFLAEEFFDARDTVQVKYEMVRAVLVDGEPVTAAAAAFGYSRQTYYQAAAALEQSGLDGLLATKPGPRGGHKLTEEILAWAEEQLGPLRAQARGAGRGDRAALRRARAPPLDRTSAGPPPGALQKPLTHTPTTGGNRSPRHRPCDLRLATRLLNQTPVWMPARILFPAARPAFASTPATSSCVTLPCTHAPARSRSGSACSSARASPPGSGSWPT